MKMLHRIETLPPKKLAGLHLFTSFANDRTGELWRSLMMRRSEFQNRISTEFISMQVYPQIPDFKNFDPTSVFEKWATVELEDFSQLPTSMESFILPGGLYACFHYVGDPVKGQAAFEYIFAEWLSASPYELDHRPHFEVLGSKYKNGSAESEEDIWIPIRLQKTF